MNLDLGRIIIDTVALLSVFGWPVGLAWVITRHKQKMREMEYRQSGSPGLVEEVAALREELAQLRDTTTRFDMGYDAALDRLERRMDRVEAESSVASPEAAASDTTFRASVYRQEAVEEVPLRRS